MKNLKNFKKFGAALTAVAMLGTLSTGVFAAEVDEITDVPVIESVEIDVPIIAVDVEDIEDVEEADLGELLVDDIDLMSTTTTGNGDVTTDTVTATKSDITITAVTAEKSVVDEVTLYNVKLAYEMPVQTVAPQVTLLGYVFTNEVPATIEDSAIKAVDQKTHVELGDGAEVCKGEIDFVLSSAQAGISDTATLVLMVGTDGDLTNEGAQAVAIDLSLASAGEGEGGEDVTTTWEATGATVAPTTISVVAGATDASIKAELAEAVVTVTGADSKSSTNVSVAWATADTIADGTTVTYTGTVTPGADADWTGSQTVEVKVTIAAAQGGGEEDDEPTEGLLGDASGDNTVDGRDAIAVQKYVLFNTAITKPELADVDLNTGVDGRDAIAIQKYVLFNTALPKASK